jgi:hypothetical protein
MTGWCQFEPSQLAVLDSAIARYRGSGKLYFAQITAKHLCDHIQEVLSVKPLTGIESPGKWQKIPLSRKERRELRASCIFATDDAPDITENFFPNSVKLPDSSIWNYVSFINRAILDSLRRRHELEKQSWANYSQLLLRWFEWSRPVYFRKKTVCLIYFAWHLWGGGEERFLVLKKTEGVWVKWMTIPLGAW